MPVNDASQEILDLWYDKFVENTLNHLEASFNDNNIPAHNKDAWLKIAIDKRRTALVDKMLDASNVPKDLTLQERIAYYDLFVRRRL